MRASWITLAGLVVAIGVGVAGPGGTRSYRLGFTPFPYDLTEEAVLSVKDFLAENADIVAVHIEGVPWTEAGSDAPFRPALEEDLARQKASVPPGALTYLAVTPIHILRDGLAAYRGDAELPVPEPYAGKAFDDPIVIGAFTAWVRRAIDYFEPDRLAIGIEVDLLRNNRPDLWAAYVRLHRAVYDAVKADHPELPVFVTLTVHEMLEPDGRDTEGILLDMKALMPWSDRVALSYYPFLSSEPKAIRRRLHRMRDEFATFGKRFAIAESGHNAEPVDLPGSDIGGSDRSQRKALKKLLRFAAREDLDFVIWFVPRDYDALWSKISSAFPEWAVAWRDCGLADENGRERPALRLWRKRLRKTLLD